MHSEADDVVLSVSGLSKTYGGTKALDDVSLRVRRATVHSLIGGNGSGKSTLIKILAGVVKSDPGGVVTVGGLERRCDQLTPALAREAGLHIVHQELGVFPDMSVAENLSIGRGFDTRVGGRIGWSAVARRTRRVLERFDLDFEPEQTMSSLSPAQQTMVAVARALQDQEDTHAGVLILDEPTAALSASEVQLLLSALRRYAERGQSIVFVSHRLDEVLAISDSISVLRDGRNVETVEAATASPASLSRLIVGREQPPAAPRTPPQTGAPLLQVKALRSGPLHDISFDVRAGEIVGIAGLLGSGRSRLLRALFGLHERTGSIMLDGDPVAVHGAAEAMNAGIGYVPEDRPGEGAFIELSVASNLSATDVRRYWRRWWLHDAAERADARDAVRDFGIKLPSIDAPMAYLSGGNQQKVVVARSLRRRPRLLLLDEPSQGVDVGARYELHRLVERAAAEGAAIIAVSSDFSELAELCDRILVLVDGRIAHVLDGDQLDPAEVTRLAYVPMEETA